MTASSSALPEANSCLVIYARFIIVHLQTSPVTLALGFSYDPGVRLDPLTGATWARACGTAHQQPGQGRAVGERQRQHQGLRKHLALTAVPSASVCGASSIAQCLLPLGKEGAAGGRHPPGLGGGCPGTAARAAAWQRARSVC